MRVSELFAVVVEVADPAGLPSVFQSSGVDYTWGAPRIIVWGVYKACASRSVCHKHGFLGFLRLLA